MSELIRKLSDSAGEAWAARHPIDVLFFSAVGEAELRFGAAILAAGRRRDTLVAAIERMLRDAFENRILAFDSDATRNVRDFEGMNIEIVDPWTAA